MSIVGSKVAEPYASALFESAMSSSALKETTNDMNIVSQLLVNSHKQNWRQLRWLGKEFSFLFYRRTPDE
jgi:hypothetical protein